MLTRCSLQVLVPQKVTKSGREDLNLRPHGPEPCALAKLSYAPSESASSILASGGNLSIASLLGVRLKRTAGGAGRFGLGTGGRGRGVELQRGLHPGHEG